MRKVLFDCFLCDRCGRAHATSYNCYGDINWRRQQKIKRKISNFGKGRERKGVYVLGQYGAME
jgi:hypothetical protein